VNAQCAANFTQVNAQFAANCTQVNAQCAANCTQVNAQCAVNCTQVNAQCAANCPAKKTEAFFNKLIVLIKKEKTVLKLHQGECREQGPASIIQQGHCNVS
jgi:hypothetical protein